MSDPTDEPAGGAFSAAARVTRGDLPEGALSTSPSGTVRSVQAEPEGTGLGPPVRQGRPVRGFLWGLMAGTGLAIVAIATTTIALALVPVLLTIAIGVTVGVLWSTFGPIKK